MADFLWYGIGDIEGVTCLDEGEGEVRVFRVGWGTIANEQVVDTRTRMGKIWWWEGKKGGGKKKKEGQL